MTKKETTRKTIRENVDEMRDNLRGFGENVWFAGLGAVSAVEEKGSGMFQDLIDRGKKFDEREETFVKKTVERANDQIKDFSRKVEGTFKDGTRAVLNRFGVPTHGQIQDLIDRVDKLNAKVDKLSA